MIGSCLCFVQSNSRSPLFLEINNPPNGCRFRKLANVPWYLLAKKVTQSFYFDLINDDLIYRMGKNFTHKLSIPSRNLYQVLDLGVMSRDLHCESGDKTSRYIAENSQSASLLKVGARQNISMASLTILLNMSSSLVRIAKEDISKVWRPDNFR